MLEGTSSLFASPESVHAAAKSPAGRRRREAGPQGLPACLDHRPESRKRRRDTSHQSAVPRSAAAPLRVHRGACLNAGTDHEGSPRKCQKIEQLIDAASSVFGVVSSAVSSAVSWAVKMGSSSLRGGSHVPRDVLSDSPAPLPPPSLRAHPTAASSAQQNGGASPEVAPPPQRRRVGDTGPPTERPPPHATPGSMHVCLERLHLEADTRGPPNSVDTRAYVTISDEGEEEEEEEEEEVEEEEDSDCDVSITGIILPPRPNGVFSLLSAGGSEGQSVERPGNNRRWQSRECREGYRDTDTPQREERLGFFDAAPRGRQLRVGASAADGRSGEFLKLTKEMVLAVTEASRGDDPDEVVSRHGLHCVTRQDLNTLSGISWLNDKVIDFYMSLLSESGSSGGAVGNGVAGGAAPVYAFTTFFYTRLQEGGPAAVRRWTKRVDLFACRILLVPVHHGTHWCLVVIDICKKRITYFDPLGSSNNAACRNLLRYLCEESEAKRGWPLAPRDWALRGCMAPGLLALPRQSGSNDCGVFVCQFARSTALGLEPDFGQQHMAYFRWRMAWEILHARLL
ncbi:uncharacterized protein LOC144951488 isoform X3 [Lampetra fluviatilis]